MNDIYKTINQSSQGYIVEKKSKFISFAFPVTSTDEIKEILDAYRKKYYDARHLCWAYMLGEKRDEFRSNDDGEPSGTAGRPILGQINSHELTNVLVLVVRYFGGTLLGTSGLIKAYREAADDAINKSKIVEKTINETITIQFEYLLLNEVMRVLKQFENLNWEQDFRENCVITLRVRKSEFQRLYDQLDQIYGVSILENE